MSKFQTGRVLIALSITTLSHLLLGCGDLQSIDTLPLERTGVEFPSSIGPLTPGTGPEVGTTIPRIPAGPVALNACQERIKTRFLELETAKMAWYSSRGFPIPGPRQKSVLHFGAKDHMVVIAHGFVSDPSLQADLILALAVKGYSVLVPLMNGFGSNADAANASKIADWRGAFNDAVALAQMCPHKVSLIGHSFGGALIGGQLTANAYTGIESAVLLAPSFKSQAPFWQQTFTGILFFTDKLSAGELGDQVGIDLYEAFQIARPKNGEEPFTMPVRAASEVTAYQDNMFATTTTSTNVRTLQLLSNGDTIIRNDSAEVFVSQRFTNGRTEYLRHSDLIVHSFQRRLINPFFDQMMEKIFATLEPQ